MKYKWILFGVGSVVAVVLCWVSEKIITDKKNIDIPIMLLL